MSPVDKEFDKNKNKQSPKPPEDLRSEWAEEDREIEGRKPDLEETEQDTSEL